MNSKEKVMRILGKEGGYVFGPVNNIRSYTSPDRIIYMSFIAIKFINNN
jgi:hypothetical protein